MIPVCGIYDIYNIKSDKHYIGQSIDIRKRFYQHKYLLRNNKCKNLKFQNAWNKYGEESFEFQIIEECRQEKLDEREIFFTKKYDSFLNGYNKTDGGHQGYLFVATKRQKNWSQERIKNFVEKMMQTKTDNGGVCITCGKQLPTRNWKYCEEHRVECRFCGKRFGGKYSNDSACEQCREAGIIFTGNCVVCGERICKNSNKQKMCKSCSLEKERNRKR